MINQLILGDCIDVMDLCIPSKSIDMILCDLPYGTTQNKWDTVIPFVDLWREYERVIKDTGAIVLTASQPFTSALTLSNILLFKYSLVWDKRNITGFLNAKKQPLRQHEDILVFYKRPPVYNPIMHGNKLPRDMRGSLIKPSSENYGSQKDYISTVGPDESYPRSIISFRSIVNNSKAKLAHPTQKPVELFEYLIKTYSNEGDTVLDNCCGSGTTAEACINTGRNYIVIEKEKKYFNLAQQRIKNLTNNI